MSKKSKKHYRDTSKFTERTASVVSQKGDEFNPDYTDVIKDLKRIGALAGIFLTILIALSFIL
jgi:hypothetical protein